LEAQIPIAKPGENDHSKGADFGDISHPINYVKYLSHKNLYITGFGGRPCGEQYPNYVQNEHKRKDLPGSKS